ncbi:MAG: Mrp/NBP35 family ATP-binding protein [Saprospiraceae bacterium]
MNKELILKALETVTDPISGMNLVEAQRIDKLSIDGNNVNFNLVLPSLNHPQKDNLIFACIGAIQDQFADAEVNVHVTTKAEQAKAQNNDAPRPVKNIIAVASGKGGVGKSTISTNLALALHKLGAKVGLIDADLYGPSIPTMLGLKGQRPQVREVDGKPKIFPLEAYGMPVMSIGFIIEPEQAVVLRGPRLAGIIQQFFNDVVWEPLDYLIVDLPPGTGDIQLTLVQTVAVTGAVMVTTPQEVAVADALKAMNMFLLPAIDVPILGVVENMAWFTPDDLPDRKYKIFGEGGGEKLAQLGKVPVLGQIPMVMGIREAGDSGKPAVLQEGSIMAEAFLDLARKTMEQVEQRNKNLDPTKVVQVSQN